MGKQDLVIRVETVEVTHKQFRGGETSPCLYEIALSPSKKIVDLAKINIHTKHNHLKSGDKVLAVYEGGECKAIYGPVTDNNLFYNFLKS